MMDTNRTKSSKTKKTEEEIGQSGTEVPGK
jgi:hypothetical protein